MPIVIFSLYLTACVVCGIMGRNTVFGFMGHFLLALFLTPVVDFVVQAVGRPSARMVEKYLSQKSR